MHQPTKVIYEGDAVLAATFVGEASNLLHKVTSIAQAAGIGLFAKTARLADGVVAYALYTAGQSIIQITAERSTPPVKRTPPKTIERPDFFSGLVRGGTIDSVGEAPPDAGDGWDTGGATTGYRTVLKSYKPTPRWRAQYNTRVAKSTSKPKPSSLAEGYQPNERLAVDPPKWYDVFPQPDERTVPAQYMRITPSCYSGQMKKLVQYVLGLGRLDETQLVEGDPLADDVKAHGFTVRYDFRWTTTHGLVKAADKRWWLIEISQANGVLAMPLPLYEDLDDQGLTVLESEQEELKDVTAAFGGQPTGECFPTGKELTQAIAQGNVLRLITPDVMAEFYSYSPYSTTLGWAFSSDGHEAHNTAHTYEDYSDGMSVGVGVHYSIRFSIGAINTHRQENDPIATATASIVRISRGYLDRGGLKYGVQFHTPEPMLEDGGMTTYQWAKRPRRVRCDTTVHVFFIGKSLQTVRYYQDPKSLPAHVDGAQPGGCGMYSGSYAWTVYGSGGNVPSQFYTNRFDYREKIAPSMSDNTYSAIPGAFSPAQLSDWLDNPQYADVWRARAIKVRTTSQNSSGRNYRSHIACPYGTREAYVIFKVDSTLASWSTKTTGGARLVDPNRGTTFRFFYHKKPDDDSSCYDQEPRRIKFTSHAEYACSYIADAGMWLSSCQTIVPGAGAGGGASSSVSTVPKATSSCESFLVANTEFQQYALKAMPSDDGRWETMSPDEFGNVKHFNCVASALGAQHAVFNQRISTAPPPDDYVVIGPYHKEGDSGFFSYLGVL